MRTGFLIKVDRDFSPQISFTLPVVQPPLEGQEIDYKSEKVELYGSICGIYQEGSNHVLRLYIGEAAPEIKLTIGRYISQRQMEIVREFHFYV